MSVCVCSGGGGGVASNGKKTDTRERRERLREAREKSLAKGTKKLNIYWF